MRRSSLTTVAFLAVLCAPRSIRAQELTLAAVVRMALTGNERARIAALGVDSADAAVVKARAGFLPNVTLGATETLRPYNVEQNGRTTAPSRATNGTLTVTQPLVAATAFPLYAAARHARDAARYDAVNQRRELCFDAARAFFDVITAERVVTAADRRLERAQANLDDTKARAAAALVSSNDVTRSEVDRASAMQSVASAQSNLAQARANLEFVLGAPAQGELVTPTASLAPPGLDVAKLGDQALALRPDVGSAASQALAAAAQADEPGLRFVPTLNASGQARVGDRPVVGDRYVDTTLTLNLSWTIWDGGARSADADSRAAAAETAELQSKALKRKVRSEVTVAVAELIAARTSLAAAEQGVTAASRNLEETSVLYQQGLAKAIELVDANLSRFDAEVALASAQLGVRSAELDLRDALGLFPVDGVQ